MPILGSWISATNGTPTLTGVPTTAFYAAQFASTQTYTTVQTGLGSIYGQRVPPWAANQTRATGDYYWYQDQGVFDVNGTQYFALAQQRVVICRARTEEELLQQAQAKRAAMLAMEERHRAAKLALYRSRQLLLDHLTPAQQTTFEKNQWFVVEGGRTKQKYRIRAQGCAGNIDVMNGPQVLYRLCCHCDYSIPLHDQHLAQKLALQFDEERFLSIANRQAA